MLQTSPFKIAWAKVCETVSFLLGIAEMLGGGFWCGLAVGVVFGCWLTTIIAAWGGELPDQWRKAAVERGAGEWYVDDERQIQFRWKPLPEKKP